MGDTRQDNHIQKYGASKSKRTFKTSVLTQVKIQPTTCVLTGQTLCSDKCFFFFFCGESHHFPYSPLMRFFLKPKTLSRIQVVQKIDIYTASSLWGSTKTIQHKSKFPAHTRSKHIFRIMHYIKQPKSNSS